MQHRRLTVSDRVRLLVPFPLGIRVSTEFRGHWLKYSAGEKRAQSRHRFKSTVVRDKCELRAGFDLNAEIRRTSDDKQNGDEYARSIS